MLTAYKYGMDLIPYSKDDESQTKYTSEGKKLDILGFTQVDKVPHYLGMDDQAHIVIGTDEHVSC